MFTDFIVSSLHHSEHSYICYSFLAGESMLVGASWLLLYTCYWGIVFKYECGNVLKGIRREFNLTDQERGEDAQQHTDKTKEGLLPGIPLKRFTKGPFVHIYKYTVQGLLHKCEVNICTGSLLTSQKHKNNIRTSFSHISKVLNWLKMKAIHPSNSTRLSAFKAVWSICNAGFYALFSGKIKSLLRTQTTCQHSISISVNFLLFLSASFLI